MNRLKVQISFLFLLVFSLFFTSIGFGTVYYVDVSNPRAADENPGTEILPCKTFAHAVEMVKPGDTVRVKPGTYYEGSILLKVSGAKDAPIVLEVNPGDEGKVIFKGTIPVQNPRKEEGGKYPVYSVDYPREFWVLGEPEKEPRWYVDMCFQDGVLLRMVPTKEMLKPGTFWVDQKAPKEKKRLYFSPLDQKDPKDCAIEVSRHQFALHFDRGADKQADWKKYEYITIRGLTFRGYSSNPRCYDLDLANAHYCVVEDCTFEWSNACPLGIGSSSHCIIRRNKIQHIGQLGIGGGDCDNLLVEDNVITGCNYKGFSVWWESGGIKIGSSSHSNDSVFRRNIIYNNEAEGLWFDYRASNNLVENNLLYHNVVAGFLCEVAPGTAQDKGNIFRNNVFAFNRVVQGAGLSISGSSNTIVENNIFYGNEGEGIGLGGSPGQRHYTSDNDYVQLINNRMERNIMSNNFFQIASEKDIPDYAYGNKSDHNVWWKHKAEQPVKLSGKPISLEEWQKLGNDTHTLLADPLFVDPENLNFTLKPESPAFKTGFSTKGMRLDYSEYKLQEKTTEKKTQEGKKFSFVNLKPFLNRDLKDEVAGDGKGGWSDQGPNDMRGLPRGRQVLEGIPFMIAEGTKACIVLKAQAYLEGGYKADNSQLPEKVSIPVNKKFKTVYFLHDCAWTPENGGKIFAYEITYKNGKKESIEIISGKQILDWWADPQWQEKQALEENNASLVWQGQNGLVGKVGVYMLKWTNPAPEEEISSILFRTADKEFSPVPMLIAITGIE